MTNNEKKIAGLLNALAWALQEGDFDETNEPTAQRYMSAVQLVVEVGTRTAHDPKPTGIIMPDGSRA